MLDKLFSSKARVEILKLLLFNPEDSFYQRQISVLTNQSIRGVQREVENLQRLGIIEKSARSNRIYYKANRNCAIFEELKRILFKSVGIADVLKDNFKKLKEIRIAFIYGSYAKGEENLLSDIDLFVIGDITSKRLSTLLSKPKGELMREINYVVFNLRELKKRIKLKDNFLSTILREEKIFITGNKNELKAITESR